MKAIILAAGMGRRIKNVIDDKPKCFLEINKKSIIQHQIDTLRSFGINEIIIAVGYKKECFAKLKQQYNDIIKLVYNPFYKTTNVLGSFWFVKDFLTEPFIFIHGDTYFEPDILNRLMKASGNVLAVEFKTCGTEEMKIKVQNGKVIDISKKLLDSDGEFIGVAKIECFSDIKSTVETLIEDNCNAFFEIVIRELIKSSTVFNVVDVTDLIWEEIDFKEDYTNLINKIKNQK